MDRLDYTSAEVRSLAFDVKMQIGGLQAKLVLLQELDAVTPAIKELLATLTQIYDPNRPPLGQSSLTRTVTLDPPQYTRVRTTYVGKSYKEPYVKEGETVIVHAWKKMSGTAVIHVPRTGRGGEVPESVLVSSGQEPVSHVDVCMLRIREPRNGSNFKDLGGKEGDYIRICNFAEGSNMKRGSGINLATLEFGYFDDGYTLEFLTAKPSSEGSSFNFSNKTTTFKF